MIAYSDTIIKNNDSPVINFELKSKLLLNSSLTIFSDKEKIFNKNIEQLSQSIIIDGFDKNYIEFVVEVEKNNKKIKFPVSVLKLKENDPYIICDIDFTVSDTNIFFYMTNNILHIKTLCYSAEILQKLSNHFKIIYLTGRLDKYTKLTRHWLKKNFFPQGPIIARKNESSFKLQSFKYNALKKVIEISRNGIGIGDLKSDILAYISHNLTAIKIKRRLFFNNDSYTFCNGYYEVNNWKGIENIFDDKFLKN